MKAMDPSQESKLRVVVTLDTFNTDLIQMK